MAEDNHKISHDEVQTPPELLYHTILHYTNSRNANSPFLVCPLATHTDLNAAKGFARLAVPYLGYRADDFVEYEVYTASTKDWKHGDGTIVWAKAANDTEVTVAIETTPNNEAFPENPDHTVQLPAGCDRLHYVVQITIDINRGSDSAAQQSTVEGVYAHRSAAITAANHQLDALYNNRDFTQYEARKHFGNSEDWPYGEDVIVHAIAETGENFYVAVKTVPDTEKAYEIHQSNIQG